MCYHTYNLWIVETIETILWKFESSCVCAHLVVLRQQTANGCGRCYSGVSVVGGGFRS